MKSTFIILTITVLCLFSASAQQIDFPRSTEPYLGHKPPGSIPEVLAPDIISIENGKEFKPTISPDGKEIFFMRRTPNKRNDCIYYSKVENGVLINPLRASFSYNCFEGQPTFSPDGKRLYYMSCRPLPGTTTLCQLPNLWYVEKNDSGWSEPFYLPNSINDHRPAQISFSNAGNAFFVSNITRKIYSAAKLNDSFDEAKLLDCGINYLEPTGHPSISPDESYIIVDRIFNRNNKMVSEMYVSFKMPDGKWSNVLNLNEALGIKPDDIFSAPRITYDGRFLFFSSNVMETDKGDLYWVSTKVIEELRPKI
jgi:Tol biopolymer transport system component